MREPKTCVKRTTLLFLTAMLGVLAGTAVVDAGEVSYIELDPFFADTDSGISPFNTYTHLLDFGNRTPAATVNGVLFDQVNLGALDTTADFSYTINSGTRNSHGGNPNTGVDATQGLNELLYDMVYNGNCAPGGVATITLSGLTPGAAYETRLYSRQWGPDGAFPRSVSFDFDMGDPGAISTIGPIDQDDASLTPPSDGSYLDTTAYAIAYRFTAGDAPLTISLTQDHLNYSWHVYGLTNEEFGVTNLAWDGGGNGTWNTASRWAGDTAGSPDFHTNTTIELNMVSVSGETAARSLGVDLGGAVTLGNSSSLVVGREAEFAEGTTLTLGSGAEFVAAGGALDRVVTNGNAVIGVRVGEMPVARLTAAAGTVTKYGAGTLSLDNLSGGVSANPATIFKVEDGVLSSRGLRPLGQAGAVELAGGTLRLEGGAGAPIDGPPGAVAYYPFDTLFGNIAPNDGSAGVVLDGMLIGDATQTTGNGGVIGEGMQFDGAGYIEVPFDPALGLNEFSVSAWVKFANEPVGEGILGTRIGGDTTFDVKVRSGDVHGDVGSGAGWINTGVDIRPEDVGSNGQGGDLSLNEWHMVTYVVNETDKQFQLYLDGDQKRTIDYAGTPLFMKAGQSLWIGDDYVGHEPLNGLIDEVYIYGRALDTDEVSDLWGNGFGPNDGNSGLNTSGLEVLVTDDSTLHAAHGAVGGGPATFAELTLRNGALTTAGTLEGIQFPSTLIAAEATAVGFDPQTPTNYGTITNASTAAEVTVAKTGPSTWRLDAPLAGRTDNIRWQVDDGTLIARGAGTLDGRGLTVAGGTLDIIGETSTGGAAIELSGGRLRVEGIAGPSQPGPAGAVAHYAFDTVDAGTTPNDGSAGAVLNGTLVGDAELTARGDGIIGEAIQFSGDGYVEVPFDAALGLNEFTVSAWVNLTAPPTAEGILGTRINGDTTFDVKVQGNYIHGDIGDGTNWINTTVDIRPQDTGSTGQGGTLGAGDWHMVTYVANEADKQFQLYLDGDLKRTVDYAGTPLLMKAGQSLWIGDDYGGREPMNGLIDEVYVYDVALDAAQVGELWGSGFGPNDGTSGLDMSNTAIVVRDDSALQAVHGAAGGGPAEFAGLTLVGGALTTTGTSAGIRFADTTIDADATAVGFDPQVPTDYGTITNASVQEEVILAKAGPSTWRLDTPISGTTDNVTWQVDEGALVVRGENTLSGRPINVTGGTLDLIGETSLGGAAIELSGGTLKLTGLAGDGVASVPGDAIAHYAFDTVVGDGTANDGSAGATLDGVLFGDAALTADGGGLIGEALHFGGNGRVEVAYDAALELSECSVSAWINLDSNPFTNLGILGTRIGGEMTFDLKVRNADIHGDVGSGTGWIDTNVDIGAGHTGNSGLGGDLPPGEWHMVTYVIDDTEKQFDLYLDGDLKRTIAYAEFATPLLMRSGQSLWIGDDYLDAASGAHEGMQGTIDEVSIFDYALDAGQVAKLWGSGFGPNDGTAGLDMSNTDVSVTDDATIFAMHAGPGGGPAPFGNLMIVDAQLTSLGTGAGIGFAGTIIPDDAADVIFNTLAPIHTGPIDGGEAEVEIAKTGPSYLVLDQPGTNLLNATLDVQQGRLVVVDGADALGDVDLQLGGGELVVAGSANAGPVVFDKTFTAYQDSNLLAGAGHTGTADVTVALGSATAGPVIDDGATLSVRTADGYSLDVAGAVSGNGTLEVVQGDVVLSGASNFGGLAVSGGALQVDAIVDVDDFQLADGTVDVNAEVTAAALTLTGGILDANAGVTVGGLAVADGVINAGDGGVTVDDGGVMSLGATTHTASGGPFHIGGRIDVLGADGVILDGGTVTVYLPSVPQGGLSYHRITSDADSGIDAAKTYTHAIDFGNGAPPTVNGVAFAGDFSGNGSQDIPNSHGGNLSTPVTGDVAEVFRDMRYNNPNGSIVLTGLTPGNVYDFRLYNRSWGQGFNRSQRFDYDVNSDGSIETTVTLNPDAAAANPPGLTAWNDGNAMSYTYVAGAGGELKVGVTQLGGGSYHLYGLTNEVVPTSSAMVTLYNLSGNGTIAGESMQVRGLISPGDSAGVINVNGELEMAGSATYLCEIDGLSNDVLVNAGNAEIYLGGTLDLVPIAVDPAQIGTTSVRTIMDTTGEGTIREKFTTAPPAGTAAAPLPGHLGMGVFNLGIDYEETVPAGAYTRVTAELYTAQGGDGNADGNVDGQDIQTLIINFNLPGDPPDRDWTKNDTAGGPAGRGDGWVDGQDITDLITNFTGDAGPVTPGSAAAEYNPATGEFKILVDGVMNWTLSSDGQFNGSALGALQDILPLGGAGNLVSANGNTVGEGGFGVTMDYTDVNLGPIAASGTDVGQFTLTYVTSFGAPPQIGSISVVPEPGMGAMLLAGLMGMWLVWRRRRREG